MPQFRIGFGRSRAGEEGVILAGFGAFAGRNRNAVPVIHLVIAEECAVERARTDDVKQGVRFGFKCRIVKQVRRGKQGLCI